VNGVIWKELRFFHLNPFSLGGKKPRSREWYESPAVIFIPVEMKIYIFSFPELVLSVVPES
jgi:hypothetical protein